jgi:hypothetical protein
MKAFVMVVIAVLVAIAIGVGASASAWNQPIYGPSWGRFTVAFPAKPAVTLKGDPTVWTAKTSGPDGQVKVSVTVERYFRGAVPSVAQAEAEAEAEASFTTFYFVHSFTKFRDGDVSVLRWAAQCDGPCFQSELVFHGRIMWLVGAVAADSRSVANPRSSYAERTLIVQSLLATFLPLA